jgi:hypothetical protein
VKQLMPALILSVFLRAMSVAVGAQSPEAAPRPQTARQALIEMFSFKTPDSFLRHLPAVTLSALDKTGALERMQPFSMISGQLHANGKQVQTFDTGSILLTSEDPKTGQTLDVIVESDSVQGDGDNIELTFQTYKEKQARKTPFMPRMTFAMKMESGVWKLNEILISVRLPLADPDFLMSITEAASASKMSTTPIQTQAPPMTPALGFDNSILSAMRSILTAEIAYRANYPAVGFTCTLSDLDGFGGGEPNEHQAMLIPSSLASGKRFGYEFTLSGCTGSPATDFQLMAAPRGNIFGRRAFCSDKSGAIHYSADGNAANCLASGTPLH